MFSGAVKPDSKGVCISKGGRFPPYESEGKPPKSVGRGSKDLTMCRVFCKRTCCSLAQTNPAFVVVRNLATYGEASQDCLHLFELLECSVCNPNVGSQPGPSAMGSRNDNDPEDFFGSVISCSRDALHQAMESPQSEAEASCDTEGS